MIGDDCGQGQYLTRCCIKLKPDWDSGKFHNHCTVCPGLGVCISDYRSVTAFCLRVIKFYDQLLYLCFFLNREGHCPRCDGHYFAGFISSYPCNCAKVFRMVSKAKKGDRAALAALFFNSESKPGHEDDSDSEDMSDESEDEEDDWETESEDEEESEMEEE